MAALRSAWDACVGDTAPLQEVLSAQEAELEAFREAAKRPRTPRDAAQQALARHRRVQKDIARKDRLLALKREQISKLQEEASELEA